MEDGVEIEDILLLDNDASGACKGMTIREKIISRLKETKNYLYSSAVMYTSLTEVIVLYIYYSIFVVLFWLFLFCFL